MVQIQPFGDRVSVKVIKLEDQIVDGLFLPSEPIEKSNKGIIEALGDGDEVKGINIGDIVLFSLGNGTSYTDNENFYRILNVRDIIGKIVEGE